MSNRVQQAYEAGVKLAYISFMNKLADDSENPAPKNPTTDKQTAEPDADTSGDQDPALEPNYFTVGKGGYGAQLAAMKKHLRDTEQANALDGYSYQDIARAMNNRVLRPGDRLDVNTLLSALDSEGDTPVEVERRQGKQRAYSPVQNLPMLPSKLRARPLPVAKPAAPTATNATAAPTATNATAAPPAPPAPDSEPNYFTVDKGGYGTQFAAVKKHLQGTDQANALDDYSYQDMARAMGSRGLRPGDRFNVDDLLQNMQAMRTPGAGAPVVQPLAVQRMQGSGKARGYKDIGTFQTVQQQRAAATRNSAPANENPLVGLRGAGAQKHPNFTTSAGVPQMSQLQSPITQGNARLTMNSGGVGSY